MSLSNMRVIVLGASNNPDRMSNKVIAKLIEKGYEPLLVGIKKGEIEGVAIINTKDIIDQVHTITIYLNPVNQPEWYGYISETNPVRLILNPGTENDELKAMALLQGIEVLEECTIVLLNSGRF